MKNTIIFILSFLLMLLATGCKKDNSRISIYTENMTGDSKVWVDPSNVNGATWTTGETLNLNGDERTPAMIRAVNPDIDPEIVKVRDKAMRVTEKNRHPNPKAHAYEADFIESWLRGI